MPDSRYLIVGGGMTADAAVRGIRQVDDEGEIRIISSERHPPYDRPPLSKGLWTGNPVDEIWRDTGSLGVALELGRTVEALDLDAHRVRDDRGDAYGYERLLLATGGAPRRLPFGGDDVIYFRTLDDYERLRSLAERGDHFAVIGGGYIGSEIAAALAMNDKRVTMLFPEDGIGGRRYPPALSRFLNDYYAERGVHMRTGEMVADIERADDGFVVRNGRDEELRVDGVVAGIGIEPNVRAAAEAGLPVADGIAVDAELRVGRPDVFAAGDVASFPSPALGRRVRVEHEDNANSMGMYAGRAMAGEPVPYEHMPLFYSDLFDLGYEAVGELDARLETVEDWTEPFREGVVYYLEAGRVRGVLLWNVWGRIDDARALIADPGPFGADDLRGRLTG